MSSLENSVKITCNILRGVSLKNECVGMLTESLFDSVISDSYILCPLPQAPPKERYNSLCACMNYSVTLCNFEKKKKTNYVHLPCPYIEDAESNIELICRIRYSSIIFS